MQKTEPSSAYIDEVGRHGARWLRSKHAEWILAAISFAESVFAPILIDPFLIALILAKRASWIRYIVISIVFSVLGGLVAYYIGVAFFDFVGKWVIEFYHLEEDFAAAAKQLDENGFVFVLIGALTPIPYKLVALASGLGQINFVTFFFASVVGRVLRLGLVGWATHAVGPTAVPMIRRNLLTLAYVLGAFLVVYFFIRILS